MQKSHGGVGWGLGYVQRTEVIVKMQKQEVGLGRVRVDVNEELKFL